MSEPNNPFGFQESELWKDASRKLCVDGWPHAVVILNCAMRDMKKRYDILKHALQITIGHSNCYCDQCKAISMDHWIPSKSQEMLIKKCSAYEKALEGLKVNGCFCEVGIGNPMMSNHSDSCKNATTTLKEWKGK